MDAFVNQLGAFWGPAGIICGLQFIAIVYLFKRIESAQKENIETLKLVLPMMEKFETTMKIALSTVSKAGGNQ